MESLILYFSRADENYNVGYVEKGNTEIVAEYIQEFTNATLFQVLPAFPYSKDYDTVIEEAKMRQRTHNAPIVKKVEDLKNYDTIYIGTPVYWDALPEEMVTALKNLDFTNKQVKLFVTHEGSGIASIPEQIKEICPSVTISSSIAIVGSHPIESKEEIHKWVS